MSNKTTWPLCCRISCRNSRTRRHLKCKQNQFDSEAGTTARAIETLMGQLMRKNSRERNSFQILFFCPTQTNPGENPITQIIPCYTL